MVGIEDNQVDLERSEAFLDELKVPEEKPQSQLEFVKHFINLGLNTPKIRVKQAQLFYDLVSRFDNDHSMYSSLVDKLQAEVAYLNRENNKVNE